MPTPDVNKIEKEILDFWTKNKIFAKTLKARDKKFYSFFDGPPFATGSPHYGHILASTIKDLIGRYWTMKGYHVPRRWGWDCHGLPIENIIEEDLHISGKKEIEKMGVGKFNTACRNAVLKYADEWGKMVRRIGRWVDFENSYKTMDKDYIESVWWALKKIWDKGLIYEGKKVLLYCPRCETPISNFEVAMDNSYKELKEESIFVKFRLEQNQKFPKNTLILAWTTTQWTLSANIALAVGKELDYVLYKNKENDEHFIIAKSRESVLTENLEKIKTFKGSDLIGLKYEPLYDLDVKNEHIYEILAANFVTTEDGTGVVHIATGYGEDDYNLGLEYNLPVVLTLDEKGHFKENTPEFIQKKYFKESEKLIVKDLEDRGLLFKKELFSHSYPFCWRCGTELYYSAIPAWFINIQKIKDRLIELNENINWYPEHLKHGRFKNGLKDAPDWNISRNRYWATAIPIWICENKNCLEKICLGSHQELKEKALNFDEVYENGEKNFDPHKPKIDKIKIKCEKCGEDMSRIKEVLDCWFESASMPFAEIHYPFKNDEKFEKRFPAKFVSEYISQTRAWFYVTHVISTILFDRAPFENVLATGTILNEKGEKLSKSKKNYPDPNEIIDKYGADALRFYLMNSVVMKSENLLFNEKGVQEMYRKVIMLILNILSFYKLYQKDKNVSQKSIKNLLDEKNLHILDKWLISNYIETAQNITKSFDKYNVIKASDEIIKFIDDFSTWYLRRSRERFKNGDELGIEVFGKILIGLAKLLAPICPFTAEYVYHELGGKKESLHLANWPKYDEDLMNNDLMENMALGRQIAALALSARAEKGIKVRQPLSELVINTNIDKNLLDLIADETNIKKITIDNNIKNYSEKSGWAVKNSQNLYVALNLEITPELKNEGILRELIRNINDLRKASKLTIKDKINIKYSTRDKDLENIISQNKDKILKEVIALSFEKSSSTLKEKIKIEGKVLEISLN